jgi:hypothetical protein
MNLKGSGKKALLGKDPNEGMGGIVHPPLPPLPACVAVTVCDETPVPATVMLAVRADVPVFC